MILTISNFRRIWLCSVVGFICLLGGIYFVVLRVSLSRNASDEPGQNDFQAQIKDRPAVLNAEEDNRLRLEHVGKVCQQFHLGQYKWSNNTNDLRMKEPPTPLYSFFFWNRSRRLAWCPVYKAGSTSWLKNMMRLAGFDEATVDHPPKQLSKWAREIYGDEDNFHGKEWDNSKRLLVVRHPFDRLLSAYRDKLANASTGHQHGTHHFYQKYGSVIVEKFRTDPTISQIEPTWEEFVRYILKTDLLLYSDDHWLPVYYSCTPCLVEYDFIAKTETYDRDQRFIISNLGLEHKLKPQWSHSTVNQDSQARRMNITNHYFGQLTKVQIQQLYEKYKLDFLLFGYSPDEYKKLGKDENNSKSRLRPWCLSLILIYVFTGSFVGS